MNTKERRIVVDETFERALSDVVDAFVREGFTIEALDGGDLRQRKRLAIGSAMRCSRRHSLSCAFALAGAGHHRRFSPAGWRSSNCLDPARWSPSNNR